MDKKKLKQLEKKCIFCKNSNLEQLDVHRIIAGELGGKYTPDNVVVVCCNCHRKLHTTDEIKIDKWFFSTMGRLLHCFINGVEHYLK